MAVRGRGCKTFMRGFDSHPRLQLFDVVVSHQDRAISPATDSTDPKRPIQASDTERQQRRAAFLAGSPPGPALLVGDVGNAVDVHALGRGFAGIHDSGGGEDVGAATLVG